ncbi:MAG: formylglycine-generating enzyme family protein [Planctomycetales bacterium]|nr:formylglycine-generating enzyme family protein [Planctomycetales bacterium]
MKFRLIPPGEFMMGSTPEEIAAALKDVGEDKHWQECLKSEAPQHKVILTQPIYLGVNEVTQGEYEKVIGTNPSYFAKTGVGKEAVAGLQTSNHPVEMVSWNDTAEFCAKLSQQEKLKPFYFRAGETITPLEGTGYRLPSEAEWEFACGAGTATKYWIGDKDEDLLRVGWLGANAGGRTHAAGELKANPFGLYDIHGNVWEWVQDGWDATYYGQFQDKPATDPNSPFSAGSQRVVRGGYWYYLASGCRSSARNANDPARRGDGVGFRLSLTVDAVKAAVAASKTSPTASRDKLSMHDPAFQQWMQDVAAMPAEKQVEAVAKKLVELNPKFNGKVTGSDIHRSPEIDNGSVTQFGFDTDHISDISPVRALSKLKALNCSSIGRAGNLADLSPLTGMSLSELICKDTAISDLSPLQGMPLTVVYCPLTNVSDLSPLTDCKSLQRLSVGSTKVTAASVAALQQSLPNCKIDWDDPAKPK